LTVDVPLGNLNAMSPRVVCRCFRREFRRSAKRMLSYGKEVVDSPRAMNGPALLYFHN
jgi:hypothetical protein